MEEAAVDTNQAFMPYGQATEVSELPQVLLQPVRVIAFVGDDTLWYTAPLEIEATNKTCEKHVQGVASDDENSRESIQRWTSKRRMALVMSILRGDTSVQEAARRHGLTVDEVEGWRDKFLLGA